MEGMDGLETAGRIKAECPKVHIVLVTANVNYALDGYKVKASRFLLKDDLEQTLPECLDDILREERVVEFGFVEGNVRLRVDDIIYIETSRHKNVFHTAGQAYSIYKKMDELEAELAGMGFVRIHQSFLINMKYIERIRSYVMILTTGKEISVPKSRYQEVKRQYTLYKGGGVIMGLWILFLPHRDRNMGSVYFFDTFLSQKKGTPLCQYRFLQSCAGSSYGHFVQFIVTWCNPG